MANYKIPSFDQVKEYCASKPHHGVNPKKFFQWAEARNWQSVATGDAVSSWKRFLIANRNRDEVRDIPVETMRQEHEGIPSLDALRAHCLKTPVLHGVDPVAFFKWANNRKWIASTTGEQARNWHSYVYANSHRDEVRYEPVSDSIKEIEHICDFDFPPEEYSSLFDELVSKHPSASESAKLITDALCRIASALSDNDW